MEYTTDPNHWSNRYPWNRKGTAIRLALEQFLNVTSRAPGSEQEERRKAIAWLQSLLDKKPGELFP